MLMELIFSLGYITTVISFLFIDLFKIRIFYSISCIITMFGAYMYSLSSTFYWNLVLLLVNVVYITFILWHKIPFFLPKELRSAHKKFFNPMSAREFNQFCGLAKKIKLKKERLLRQGVHVEQLFLLLKGKVEIIKDGKHVRYLSAPCLLGEMQFVSRGVASTDVIAVGRIELLQWDRSSLNKYAKIEQSLYKILYMVIAFDLIEKLK